MAYLALITYYFAYLSHPFYPFLSPEFQTQETRNPAKVKITNRKYWVGN